MTRRPYSRCALSIALATLASCLPLAQGQEDEERPIIRDSTVGYIDSAIPGDQIRLRYDSAYRNNVPSRAEFFYSRTGIGRVLESNVDYQDISLYVEKTFGQRLSAFAEAPVRFANFQNNPNHHGLADMNAGFKFAFFQDCNTVASAQLRVYLPTGDADRGLGTDHVSIEPSILLFARLTRRLASESEVRLWVPVGGTPDFAGEVIRYGTGLRYDVYQSHNFTVAPVIEAVGWTFLDGKETRVQPSGAESTESASGDTIVNVKAGLRLKIGDRMDIYGGYGRAVTGEVLYKDVCRVEFRLLY